MHAPSSSPATPPRTTRCSADYDYGLHAQQCDFMRCNRIACSDLRSSNLLRLDARPVTVKPDQCAAWDLLCVFAHLRGCFMFFCVRLVWTTVWTPSLRRAFMTIFLSLIFGDQRGFTNASRHCNPVIAGYTAMTRRNGAEPQSCTVCPCMQGPPNRWGAK